MAGFDNDVMYALNADFTRADNQTPSESNGLINNGRLWIGSTATNAGGTHINVGQITSPLGTLTIGYSSPDITLDLTGGGTAVQVINGDSGFISGSNVTVFADNVSNGAGGTVLFTNSGTVSTFTISDVVSNIYMGQNCGNNLQNTTNCTAVGVGAMGLVTAATQNTAFGYGVLSSYTGGGLSNGNNTATGFSALNQLLTGQINLALGSSAGTSYTSTETNNILLENAGVIADSNTIRIGRPSGTNQHTTNFQGGITGVTVAASAPIAIAATGQISSLGFGSSTQVLTSNGAGNSPTWQAAGGGGSTTYFQAYRTSNQTVAGGDQTTTIVFDTAIANVGSAYATGTGIFTAPGTGYYGFSTTVNFANLTTPAGLSTVILGYTGSVQSLRLQQFGLVPATTGAAIILTASWAMPMTAGDTVKIQPFADGTGNYTIFGTALGSGAFNAGTTFSGWRIA